MTEWNASAYQRQSSLQQKMADEVLSRLTFQGDERVLDVGCGDGKVTAAIAALVPRGSVMGIDASQDMITFSAQRYPPQDYPNLRFAVGDARAIPFHHEFDLAVSFNALHWVHDQDAALSSLRAALKHQGRAFLRFVPESDRPSLEDIIEEVIQRPRWSSFFRGHSRPHAHFTPAEYRTLVERNRFRVVGLRDQAYVWQFDSREAFAGWLGATGVAWVQKIPAEMKHAFLNEVLDAYHPIAADHPGEVNVFKYHQMDVELLGSG